MTFAENFSKLSAETITKKNNLNQISAPMKNKTKSSKSQFLYRNNLVSKILRDNHDLNNKLAEGTQDNNQRDHR